MPRLSEEKWSELRTEFEMTDVPLETLANKYGITQQAVSKKKIKEGWIKNLPKNINDMTLQKVYELSCGEVVNHNHKKVLEIKENVAQLHAGIVIKHRKEWEKLRELRETTYKVVETPEGLELQEDFNKAKFVKITSETTEIIQRNERKAYGLDKLELHSQLSVKQLEIKTGIIEKLIKSEIDIHYAAAYLEKYGIPLPDFIRIILQRTPVLEKEDALPEYDTDILDAQYEEAMAKIEQQKREWLPERVEDVLGMKKEVESKDVFKQKDNEYETSGG